MDRGMQMGEGGRVEPVASLPGPSGLKELREKIVLVDALIHADDCESKDVHSTRCKASGEVLGLFDALFPAAQAAPEPAPGEGSPSHPSPRCAKCDAAAWSIRDGKLVCHYCQTPFPASGPSQDSQEVREAGPYQDDLELAAGFVATRGMPNLGQRLRDLAALLSQSPKGVARYALDQIRAIAAFDARNGRDVSAETILKICEKVGSPKGGAGARCPHAWEMEVDGYYRCYLCKERTLDPEEGESGPSAPKTGLRGADAPGDGDVRTLVKAAGAAMEDIEIADLMKWDKGLALVNALRPFAQPPAPGDVGEAGGVDHG